MNKAAPLTHVRALGHHTMKAGRKLILPRTGFSVNE